MTESFSRRHGFEPDEVEIRICQDAPEELRGIVVDIAYESSLSPHALRAIVSRVLRVREDPSNWSEFPNVDGEVRGNLDNCAWYEVYDVIEALHENLRARDVEEPWRHGERRTEHFETELNRYFRQRGIGWQLVEGRVQIRGAESFETTVAGARDALQEAERQTAANEIHQALQDLSRRPHPDLTGALQHGLAALECALRDACGDHKATLGQLLAKYPGIVPRPLDQALEKIWGFASEHGRHLSEGREPNQEEVVLVVEVAAATISYVAKRLPQQVSSPGF